MPVDTTLSTLRGRIGALALHASYDPKLTTANGRAAFLARFEREADPDGTLDPAERQRRALLLRRLYFTRLALASAKARRKKAAARLPGGAK